MLPGRQLSYNISFKLDFTEMIVQLYNDEGHGYKCNMCHPLTN